MKPRTFLVLGGVLAALSVGVGAGAGGGAQRPVAGDLWTQRSVEYQRQRAHGVRAGQDPA